MEKSFKELIEETFNKKYFGEELSKEEIKKAIKEKFEFLIKLYKNLNIKANSIDKEAHKIEYKELSLAINEFKELLINTKDELEDSFKISLDDIVSELKIDSKSVDSKDKEITETKESEPKTTTRTLDLKENFDVLFEKIDNLINRATEILNKIENILEKIESSKEELNKKETKDDNKDEEFSFKNDTLSPK